MTIIDILNNIANKKEVPEKIKCEDKIYIYDHNYKDYYVKGYIGDISYSLFENLFNYEDTVDILNKEVEIIEEDKEIEEIPLGYTQNKLQSEIYEYQRCVFNELIQAVNKINKQLNK